MQNKNVVINKNCHSRILLSGIYNACNDAQGGDPRQRHSGMTPNFGDDANKYAGMTAHLYPLTCPSGHPLQRGSTFLQPPYGLAGHFPHKGGR